MQALKKYLRSVAWLYRINAWFKCWTTKRRYRATLKFYENISLAGDAPSDVRLDSKANGRRPRVFFLGTDEQQDKSGFLQALQRIADVESFTREDGAWGQNDPAPYDERRERNTRRLWALISELAGQGWVPDILLAQTSGCFIDPAVLGRIREAYATQIVNITMDDRHQYWGSKINGAWDGSYSLIPYVDLTLTAAPEAVDWYLKEGGAAMFFPEASDPELFRPMPTLAKCYEVCLVGSRYGIREQVVKALRAAGIDVITYGSGWENGRIDIENVPRLFAQSKIVLGVSAIGHCPDFVGLKLRDFDAPMSGSCYLTQDNADLHPLYDIGREIVTYQSVQDCVIQAKRLLQDDDLREAIGRAGRVRAEREHSWDRRFSGLLR